MGDLLEMEISLDQIYAVLLKHLELEQKEIDESIQKDLNLQIKNAPFLLFGNPCTNPF